MMHKRLLPCGCFIEWNDMETSIDFCIAHSFEYDKWEDDDERFIIHVTASQREIRSFDKKVLMQMR